MIRFKEERELKKNNYLRTELSFEGVLACDCRAQGSSELLCASQQKLELLGDKDRIEERPGVSCSRVVSKGGVV